MKDSGNTRANPEARRLPPEDWRLRAVISVEEGGAVLDLSRNSAYKAAKNGELPVLRLGGRLVVPVAKLRQLLGEAS